MTIVFVKLASKLVMFWARIFGILTLALTTYGQENQTYRDGYGKEWLYFPDGYGKLHYVNLTYTPLMARRLLYHDIQYRLYSRRNFDNYILLDDNANPLNGSGFTENLSRLPIKLVTHGWRSTADMDSVINIKDAYLSTQDVIVIAVDWSKTSQSYYTIVAYETKGVGEQVGNFLDGLNKNYGVVGEQLHLIGHSCGAHVMGIAASETKLTVGRVTGLDPARPLFEFPSRSNEYKLDMSDAVYVDVIHTCSGILGVNDPTGVADFYPNNGGAPQPGCYLVMFLEACSHSRSHFYFAESIKNHKAFPARKCNNWADFLSIKCKELNYMGDNVDQKLSGKFYLETNSQIPYGRGLRR